jgi:putative spermidine/putrescine transport system ATP-binding protein
MTLVDQVRRSIAMPRAEAPVQAANVPSVALSRVAKRYGSVSAVEDISFKVPRGSFTTLLGPSGSGKTTILRMIAGFVYPTEGEILVNGHGVSKAPPHKRSIGVVFQSLALFPHLTVAENVAYPLKCRRFDRRLIPDLVDEYLGLVQLSGYQNRRIEALSGGQRQRVAIARALVYKPDLLLLDEPLAALDKKLREEIQVEFRRIQSELRITTINVTHDQREALVMSDQIVVLDHGRIQQQGAPRAIYQQPANCFVAGFIGSANIIRATGSACAIRAERVRIGRTSHSLGGVPARCEGKVRSVAYEGDRALYEVELADSTAPFKILLTEQLEELVVGDAVTLGWHDQDLMPLGGND